MEQTKEINVSSPLSFKGKLVAYAHITGKVSYDNDKSTDENGWYFDNCYCNIHYLRLVLEIDGCKQDNTFSYLVSKRLHDNFADEIENIVFAHAEYLFDPKNALELAHCDMCEPAPIDNSIIDNLKAEL